MEKPKIFFYIWHDEKYYKELSEFLDLTISDDIPKNLEGFSEVILHSPGVKSLVDILTQTKKRNIPTIYQIEHKSLYESTMEFLESGNLSYDNLHCVKIYDKLVEKAREIFL